MTDIRSLWLDLETKAMDDVRSGQKIDWLKTAPLYNNLSPENANFVMALIVGYFMKENSSVIPVEGSYPYGTQLMDPRNKSSFTVKMELLPPVLQHMIRRAVEKVNLRQ